MATGVRTCSCQRLCGSQRGFLRKWSFLHIRVITALSASLCAAFTMTFLPGLFGTNGEEIYQTVRATTASTGDVGRKPAEKIHTDPTPKGKRSTARGVYLAKMQPDRERSRINGDAPNVLKMRSGIFGKGCIYMRVCWVYPQQLRPQHLVTPTAPPAAVITTNLSEYAVVHHYRLAKSIKHSRTCKHNDAAKLDDET